MQQNNVKWCLDKHGNAVSVNNPFTVDEKGNFHEVADSEKTIVNKTKKQSKK